MKSRKPLFLATVVATGLFAHDALAGEARSEPTAAFVARVASADAPVLIASSDGPVGIEQAAAPAVGWDPGKRGAREAALQGRDALRRFVQRTQTIYALQYGDFASLDR